MPNTSAPPIILVTEAAALVPLGARRFRQVAGLESAHGRDTLGFRYVGGRAALDRAAALAVVERLRTERASKSPLRQANLGAFVEQCAVDPDTGERLCLEPGCAATVVGRGKLCAQHRDARAAVRAQRRAGRRHPDSEIP